MERMESLMGPTLNTYVVSDPVMAVLTTLMVPKTLLPVSEGIMLAFELHRDNRSGHFVKVC